jgi:glycosyltransferase involved in cell wall biosynthesis
MRILFLNTYKDWGGDEKWTVNIGDGLRKKGHHVVISSLPGSETEKRALEKGLEIFPFRIGPDIAFWKVPNFKGYVQKNKIDVVVCVQNNDVKVGGLAAKLAGVKVVLARQTLDTIKRRPYHKLAFTKFVHGIITNSYALKDLYMNYGWFKEDFFHPIHDGMEISENVEDIDLRSMFDLPEDSTVLVGAGRIVHQKGFDLLIDVARMASDNELNWRFLVVGTGQIEDQLKKKATELKVDDYIKFIGFREDVLPIMKAADLFVLSSRSDSMTNVLRGAMSVETACVATDVYGISELIEHEKSGYIVEPERPRAIYDGIKYVLSNPDIKAKIEKNSLKRIKSAFSMQKMIDETEALFVKLLKKKGVDYS